MEQILVEQYRAETLECDHRGHICGVGSNGKVTYFTGDRGYVTFLRSSAKPVQAIPAIRHGLAQKLHLTCQEIAVMVGSHRAEPFHVEVLESIMNKAMLSEDQLVCLPAYPLSESAKETLLREQRSKRRLYHNCSGKHLGILATCKLMGYDLDSYWELGHPVQQEIRAALSYLSEQPEEDIIAGVDGCGLPVFALRLENLARVYLKLACPELIHDSVIRSTVEHITKAMNDHPEMVAGTSRICSTLLQDSNIVAKDGAKGVYCFGLRKEQIGFAFKVMDGSEDEWAYIVISILEQIGYSNRTTIERMYDQFPLHILNDNQKVVGYNKAVFQLQSG